MEPSSHLVWTVNKAGEFSATLQGKRLLVSPDKHNGSFRFQVMTLCSGEAVAYTCLASGHKSDLRAAFTAAESAADRV